MGILNKIIIIINPLLIYYFYKLVEIFIPGYCCIIFLINIIHLTIVYSMPFIKKGEYGAMLKGALQNIKKIITSKKIFILLLLLVIPGYYVSLWRTIINGWKNIDLEELWKGSDKFSPLWMMRRGAKVMNEAAPDSVVGNNRKPLFQFFIDMIASQVITNKQGNAHK